MMKSRLWILDNSWQFENCSVILVIAEWVFASLKVLWVYMFSFFSNYGWDYLDYILQGIYSFFA